MSVKYCTPKENQGKLVYVYNTHQERVEVRWFLYIKYCSSKEIQGKSAYKRIEVS